MNDTTVGTRLVTGRGRGEEASKADRILAAQPLLGKPVRVIAAATSDLLGQTGTLKQIDQNDPLLTFWVTMDDRTLGGDRWAHEVVAYHPEVVDDRDEADATIEARRTKYAQQALHGKQVRITKVWGSAPGDLEVAGKVGTLSLYDVNDPRRTFWITFEDGTTCWAHDVEAVEEPQPEPGSQDVDVVQAKNAEIVRLQTTLERFKMQVREKAIEVAEEQGWCDDGLNGVLEELGLDPKQPERGPLVEFVLVTRTRIRARVDADEKAHAEDASWIRSSVLNRDDFRPQMDGDWDDAETEVVDREIEVEDVEIVEED